MVVFIIMIMDMIMVIMAMIKVIIRSLKGHDCFQISLVWPGLTWFKQFNKTKFSSIIQYLKWDTVSKGSYVIPGKQWLRGPILCQQLIFVLWLSRSPLFITIFTICYHKITSIHFGIQDIGISVAYHGPNSNNISLFLSFHNSGFTLVLSVWSQSHHDHYNT